MIYTGTQFKNKFKDIKFIKLTNKSEIHNGYHFKTGLNIDTLDFNPCDQCQPGGLYFCTLEYLPKWLNYSGKIMHYVRFVTIPDEALIYQEVDKFKANQLILSERQTIESLDIWRDQQYCLSAINLTYKSLYYIHNQTEEMCRIALRQDHRSIPYIHSQTDLICLEIAELYPLSLGSIKYQTFDVCAIAIKKISYAFNLITQPTPAVCLFAVQQNGLLLQFIKDQTFDICLAAVKQNGLALQFAKIKNQAICLAAIDNKIEALQYIKDQPLYDTELKTMIHSNAI